MFVKNKSYVKGRWLTRVTRFSKKRRFKRIHQIKRSRIMRRPTSVKIALDRAFRMSLFGALFDPDWNFDGSFNRKETYGIRRS